MNSKYAFFIRSYNPGGSIGDLRFHRFLKILNNLITYFPDIDIYVCAQNYSIEYMSKFPKQVNIFSLQKSLGSKSFFYLYNKFYRNELGNYDKGIFIDDDCFFQKFVYDDPQILYDILKSDSYDFCSLVPVDEDILLTNQPVLFHSIYEDMLIAGGIFSKKKIDMDISDIPVSDDTNIALAMYCSGFRFASINNPFIRSDWVMEQSTICNSDRSKTYIQAYTRIYNKYYDILKKMNVQEIDDKFAIKVYNYLTHG